MEAKEKIVKKLMKNKKEMKMLDSKYDYYESIKRKSDMLFYKYSMERFIELYKNNNTTNLINEEIAKEMLYNLNLNICNQCVYNYVYTYTSDDLNFITNFNIDIILKDIMNVFKDDIIKMKNIEKEKN
jgi:hypothetical protein